MNAWRSRSVAIWIAPGVILGVAGLMTLEFLEEPELTLRQALMELADPMLLVLAVAGVAYLLGRTKHQHQEHISLIRDLEVARNEGVRWRSDVHELLAGLGAAIDAQFDRWQLSAAEREVGLLMLKGLSHKEIALVQETSERTIRQHAQSIYAKADLSGRAALSAFFLEDLLFPR